MPIVLSMVLYVLQKGGSSPSIGTTVDLSLVLIAQSGPF